MQAVWTVPQHYCEYEFAYFCFLSIEPCYTLLFSHAIVDLSESLFHLCLSTEEQIQ